jgi:tryptophanase
MAALLEQNGVPFFHPVGGHGIYLDVRRFLPHLGDEDLPGQALAVELYREGGVRSVEVGRLMFDTDSKDTSRSLELVRLAIPRRVYSASHLEYAAHVVSRVYARRAGIRGIRMTYKPERLPHFTARFAPK